MRGHKGPNCFIPGYKQDFYWEFEHASQWGLIVSEASQAAKDLHVENRGSTASSCVWRLPATSTVLCHLTDV